MVRWKFGMFCAVFLGCLVIYIFQFVVVNALTLRRRIRVAQMVALHENRAVQRLHCPKVIEPLEQSLITKKVILNQASCHINSSRGLVLPLGHITGSMVSGAAAMAGRKEGSDMCAVSVRRQLIFKLTDSSFSQLILSFFRGALCQNVQCNPEEFEVKSCREEVFKHPHFFSFAIVNHPHFYLVDLYNKKELMHGSRSNLTLPTQHDRILDKDDCSTVNFIVRAEHFDIDFKHALRYVDSLHLVKFFELHKALLMERFRQIYSSTLAVLQANRIDNQTMSWFDQIFHKDYLTLGYKPDEKDANSRLAGLAIPRVINDLPMETSYILSDIVDPIILDSTSTLRFTHLLRALPPSSSSLHPASHFHPSFLSCAALSQLVPSFRQPPSLVASEFSFCSASSHM
eukprot:767632-Hanusia_phi.AAC.2